jgi:transposase-like protein
LKGTIFEKTKTPLVLWFHALMMFSNAKSGISAKELERNLAITYKCSWRILFLIRSSLRQGLEKLRGIVEADLAYLGGRRKGHRYRSEAILSKPLAMGAIERKGNVRARVVGSTGGISTRGFVLSNVEPGSKLFTDMHGSFKALKGIYELDSVNHSKKEYVRGDVHVNSIESFWSHVKRSTKGTFKGVSREHQQSYLDAFAFHYNNAGTDRSRFETLLRLVLLSGAKTRTDA